MREYFRDVSRIWDDLRLHPREFREVADSILVTGRVAQMVQVRLARSYQCVPEISANKYALNIRFIGLKSMDRGTLFDGDVEFELTFCNL